MSSASFAFPRLASPNKPLSGSERRRCTRWAVTGRATAVVSTWEAGSLRNRICPLELVNISDSGAGVVSGDAIDPGAQISVFIMPDGAEPGYNLTGTVVRCTAREEKGHSVGVRLAARMAA